MNEAIIPLADEAIAALQLFYTRIAALNEAMRTQQENIQYYQQYLATKYQCKGKFSIDMEKRCIILEADDA